MSESETKMRSITGTLTENKLTARTDDYTFNVTYLANWSINDLCHIAATRGKSKFSEAELLAAYNDLFSAAQEEVYTGATVEFGFCTNALGVEGSFIGESPKFDPEVNRVTLRCTPRSVFRSDLDKIKVIVGEVKSGLPVISKVTDVATGSTNGTITPGNMLNGEGSRVKVVGSEGKTVGFFFINAETEEETAVPMTTVARNDPSNFTFIIPALANGTYYLEVATQYSGNNKKLLKEPRRNRLAYPLIVGKDPDEEEDRPEIE